MHRVPAELASVAIAVELAWVWQASIQSTLFATTCCLPPARKPAPRASPVTSPFVIQVMHNFVEPLIRFAVRAQDEQQDMARQSAFPEPQLHQEGECKQHPNRLK